MKTILLCGYRHDATPLGLTRDGAGRTLIERRLNELAALGIDAVCVLAGEQADEQLRHAPRLAQADLAYDETSSFSLVANLRAGLRAAGDEPCFVLPVEIPCPPREVWEQLKNQAEGAAAHDVVQLADPAGAPLHFGFPLLVTAAGAGTFKRGDELTSLVDTHLNYLSVVASTTNS